MLLSLKAVRGALEQNRCVLSRAPLVAGETVLSRANAPTLYSHRLNADDKVRIRDVIQVLVAHSDEIRALIQSNSEVAWSLKEFFARCITHTDSTDEAFLHAYMFLYWEKVREEVTLGRRLHLIPRWGSKEFGGPVEISTSDDERAMSERLIRAGVEVDLFTYDAETETLALIELKRGESDDRSIGQLLRYYQTVWNLLPQSEFRKLNINYIWPILVVNRIREEHIQALPLHFRGLLDVLVFSSTGDGAPSFSSFRRGAFTSRYM